MLTVLALAQALATYVGVAVAAVLSLAALVISVLSYKVQAESAKAATISAEAAQRANWLTEQRLHHELQDRPPIRDQTVPVDQPEAEATDLPDVRWSLDRKSKNAYVLRNVGSDVAEVVSIPPESAGTIHRNLPVSATLRPNESVEFLLLGAAGSPVPNEILVLSKGREDNPDIVPVPH